MEITDHESCLGKEILACATYPDGDKYYWFLTPRYVLEAGDAIPISKKAFPDWGNIFVDGCNATAKSYEKTFGKVVILTIRHVHRNDDYRPGGDPAKYKVNLSVDIDVTAIRRSGASTRLSQIVELATPLDPSHPDEGSWSLDPNSARDIYTDRVWVRMSRGAGNVLVGPFEASQPVAGSPQVSLAAVRDVNFMVYEVPEAGRLVGHALTTSYGDKVMDFALTSLLDQAIAGNAYGASYDWVEAKLARVREKRARLEREIEEREARIADLAVEEAGLEGTIRETVSEIRDEMRLSTEIVKSSLVRQAATLALAEESRETAKPVAPFSIVGADETPHSIIDGLCDYMRKAGRDYSRNEVINFYLCLAQGYITTYAGLPGTGKTSLCRLLGEAIGLSPENGRLVEVSVERGWTSFRDYIGYYNPLTKSEVKSNADVFDALETLTAEAGGDPSKLPLCAFILDEANLSPIEHYWAQFLKACDSFATNPLKLSIGGDRTFTVPSFTRFLATVNFDHTTEELSPRFLDRSWVVMLEPRDIDVSGPEKQPSAGWRGESGACLSYAKLMDTFGADAMTDEDLGPMLEPMNAVLEACRDADRPVSPRSQRMMRSYIARALRLMEFEESYPVPVDFAVAQKVLPLIGGPSKTTETVVDKLAEACGKHNLTISSRLVERMQSSGKNSGFYQFFS